MRGISSWLRKISSTWLMAATLLLMAAFLVFVLPGQSAAAGQFSSGAGSPDLSFCYTPDQLKGMASAYGPQGRQAYVQARWSFDLAFPLVYASFLAVGISWFLNRLNGLAEPWMLANLVPVAAAILDLLENIGTSLSMAFYPGPILPWLVLASAATPLKWILVSASFLLYLALGASLLVRSLKSRRR